MDVRGVSRRFRAVAPAFTGWLEGLISLGGSEVLFLHAARLPDRSIAVSLGIPITERRVGAPGSMGTRGTPANGHLWPTGKRRSGTRRGEHIARSGRQ
jgi:hypothetical protein